MSSRLWPWLHETDPVAAPACSRKPHLQGRFSGRLATKDDEKRLLDECKLLGPLLGGAGKRGDKSRLTLAKIVRGIASGDVRKHCQERENRCLVGMGAATDQHNMCPSAGMGGEEVLVP